MKFNRTTEVALDMISWLDTADPTKLDDLDIGSTLHFKEQVARKLRKAGIIKSVRGPGGGYVLPKPVSAWRVIRALNDLSNTPDIYETTVYAQVYHGVRKHLENTMIGVES